MGVGVGVVVVVVVGLGTGEIGVGIGIHPLESIVTRVWVYYRLCGVLVGGEVVLVILVVEEGTGCCESTK